MTTRIHLRSLFSENFFVDSPNPPARQVFLTVANPGINHFLYRTRLSIELRVRAYSQGDLTNPPERWYVNMFPVVGVYYDAAASVPTSVPDPIGAELDPNWVIWDKLEGENEEVYLSTGGFRRYVRKWRNPSGVLESLAKRTPHGAAAQSLWVCWNFNDPSSFIDRTHGSFDVVYDLEADLVIDSFWQQFP